MANIQIPVLFDMSGDTIVFGEEGTGDFLSSHLDFVLDMTTEANGISLTAADISSSILVGDQDTGDSIFYSGGTSGSVGVDNLCNRIAKAITRGKLVHLPKTGNTSNSGIPMGGRANLYDSNGVYTENGNNDIYAIKYFSSIAPIGDEQMLGEAMARVASVHLVGSPLSAGIFQDKTQVQTDLETPSSHTFDGGNTAFYNALAVQLSKVLGGSKSSAPMNAGKLLSGITDINFDIDNLTNLVREAALTNKALTTSPGSANAAQLDNHNVGAIHGYSTGNQWENDADPTTGKRNHIGSNSTTNVDGTTTLDGPWIQFDAGEQVVVSHLKLWGNGNYEGGHARASAPKKFSILKSDDGTNWTTVKSYDFPSLIPLLHAGATGFRGDPFTAGYYWSGSSSRNFEINLDPFVRTRYIRMHIEEACDRYFECNEFQIIGVLDSQGTDYERAPTSATCEFNISDVTFDVAQTNICRYGSGGGNHQYTTSALNRPQGRNYFSGSPNGVVGQNSDNAFDGHKTGQHGHNMSSSFTTDGVWITTPDTGHNSIGKLWIPKEQITNSNVNQGGPYFGIDLGAQIYGATTSDVSNAKWAVASSKWYGNGHYNNHGGNPRNYTIYYSHDRHNWTIAKQVTQPASSTTTDWPSANVANEDIFDKIIVARYWMFQVNAIWKDATGCTVGEWELFGQTLANTTGATVVPNTDPPLDASGTSVPALKSIFEQLMNVPGRALLVTAEDDGVGGDVIGQTTPDPASLGDTVSTILNTNTTTNSILGMTVMPNGDIYTSGRNTHNIYKITAAGVLSEYTSNNGQTNVDGTIGVDAVTIPTGYGICNDGTSLYICCWYYHVVKKVNLSTGVVSTLAGTFGTASTTNTDSNFNKPSGICIDSAKENLYVASWQDGRIKKITISTGAVTYIAGGPPNNSQWLGTGAGAGFWRPTTITIDSTDTFLWISNREGNLSKLEISTGEHTIPGFATNGGVGSNGNAVYTLTPQETTDYRTIAIDPTDTYIYYCTPHKVKRWNISTETLEDFAGHDTETGLVEGSLTDARFDMSFGEHLVLAFDNEWNIYIAHRSTNGGGKLAISRINQIGGGSPQDILSKARTNTSGFPFITGDKLVVYLRPKINFAAQTFPEQHSEALVGFPDTVGFNVPVYNIADSAGSITSQTYSQSSAQDTTMFAFEQAMDGTGVTGTEYFTTAGNTYNNTTGVHTGAGQTTNVDGSTTLDGEWGQVDIGVSTFVKELTLTTNNPYVNRMPTEFRLLGSTDGTNWKTMIHETGIPTGWTHTTPRTYENLVAKPYRYYRYVVITIDSPNGNADARTSLGHFNLKGSLATEAFIRVGGKAGIPGFQPIAQAVQDISGLVTNFTATAQNIQDAFPGKSVAGDESEVLKWGWMGSANSDSLTLDTTDISDPTTIDLHIWKITITL